MAASASYRTSQTGTALSRNALFGPTLAELRQSGAGPRPTLTLPSAAPPQSKPTGQEKSRVVGKALAADKLTTADLKARLKRVEYVWHIFSSLLKKPEITQEDFLDAVHTAIKDKVVPASESGEIMGAMPSDQAHLRQHIENYRDVAMHAFVHLAGEAKKRTA